MSATFSAVVVARKEEALIRQCLESLAWCDEPISIDRDSQDRTRELDHLLNGLAPPAAEVRVHPRLYEVIR